METEVVARVAVVGLVAGRFVGDVAGALAHEHGRQPDADEDEDDTEVERLGTEAVLAGNPAVTHATGASSITASVPRIVPPGAREPFSRQSQPTTTCTPG